MPGVSATAPTRSAEGVCRGVSTETENPPAEVGAVEATTMTIDVEQRRCHCRLEILLAVMMLDAAPIHDVGAVLMKLGEAMMTGAELPSANELRLQYADAPSDSRT